MPDVWNPGDAVLLRYHAHGRIGLAQTARVVHDSPAELVLWWQPGWPCVRSAIADGRSLRETPPAERATLPRAHHVGVWEESEVLAVLPAGAAHSVWLMWWDGVHRSYYVNLELPHVRRQWGALRAVDTMDHELDLIISPDRQRWRWKDDEEFTACVDVPGFWTRAEAEQIRAEGDRVLTHARAGHPPFDGHWTTFRPPPTWTPPDLPPDWDQHET